MSKLDSAIKLARRWITSIPFFVGLGLVLGGLISVPVIARPHIAVIPISGLILGQAYTDDILSMLKYAGDDDRIKAVVLQIDSPGGGASAVEQVYWDLLRLRGHKPVVASVGTVAASGGYYAAIASDFIYAQPTSQLGSIGAWVNLPRPERLDENTLTSGPFKATGGSRRSVASMLEMFRQEFVSAVMLQRGDRLKLSEEEISRAEIYSGIGSLRFGLIDDMGTKTDAVEKAASLAHLRNYEVIELQVGRTFYSLTFRSADMEDLKSRTGLMPVYYYLHFEPR